MGLTQEDTPALRPVISDTLSSPPGSESGGDRYIIAGIGGAWSSYTIGDIVEALDVSPSTVWDRYTPEEGDNVYIKALKRKKSWDNSSWIAAAEGATSLEELSDIGSASPGSGNVLYGNGTIFNTTLLTKALIGLNNVENTKNNNLATADPTANDDSSEGYSVGSEWINTDTGIKYFCIDATESAAIWKSANSIATEALDSFGGFLSQLVVVRNTKSTSYTSVAVFAFPGNDTVDITGIQAVVRASKSGQNCDVRIYDVTNGNVIATGSGSGSTNTIADLTGTINNTPSDDAIFEVQIKRSGSSGGGNKVYIEGLNMLYGVEVE